MRRCALVFQELEILRLSHIRNWRKSEQIACPHASIRVQPCPCDVISNPSGPSSTVVMYYLTPNFEFACATSAYFLCSHVRVGWVATHLVLSVVRERREGSKLSVERRFVREWRARQKRQAHVDDQRPCKWKKSSDNVEFWT